MTNSKFFTQLFGDSSLHRRLPARLGYDLRKVEQTGSNFGTEVQHENPYLSSVGSGTVVADGLSIINADFSSTSFRVSRVAIGAHNFLGNRIAYPAQGRTGDNCLLATKVMVPIDGPVREGVGLLGSPSFEIPRTVERDHQLDVTEPARAAPPAAPPRTGTTRVTIAAVPAVALDAHLRDHRAHPGGASTCYSELGLLVVALVGVARARCSPSATSCWSTGSCGGCTAHRAGRLLDLRPRVLAARAVLEARRPTATCSSSTAPRSRT